MTRSWPQEAKQALRFLAAARSFLPAQASGADELLPRYEMHLRAAEFPAAIEQLEIIAGLQLMLDEEANFWKEMFYAAQLLSLPEHAARYEEKLRQISAMQDMQF